MMMDEMAQHGDEDILPLPQRHQPASTAAASVPLTSGPMPDSQAGDDADVGLSDEALLELVLNNDDGMGDAGEHFGGDGSLEQDDDAALLAMVCDKIAEESGQGELRPPPCSKAQDEADELEDADEGGQEAPIAPRSRRGRVLLDDSDDEQ
jgi:hypothetical protein